MNLSAPTSRRSSLSARDAGFCARPADRARSRRLTHDRLNFGMAERGMAGREQGDLRRDIFFRYMGEIRRGVPRAATGTQRVGIRGDPGEDSSWTNDSSSDSVRAGPSPR